jgi:3-methyl-2-oxobutanoate hydroxymethyltransferase
MATAPVSSSSAPPPGGPRARLTVPALVQMALDGRRIAMLTAYDATLAAVADRAGVDVLLVGNSLGMVVPGPRVDASGKPRRRALPHACVAAACTSALVIADLPFGT